jgi:hypothetical protein
MDLNFVLCSETKIEKVEGLPFDLWQLSNYPLLYGTILQPDGITLPEGFPYCCKFHKSIYENTQDYFDNKFPNCCDPHRELLKTDWFKKEDYKDVAIRVVTQVEYTLQIIDKYIDTDNWFDEITSYIRQVLISFGQFPIGFGEPVGWNFYSGAIIQFIRNKDFSDEKIDRLIHYIEHIGEGSDQEFDLVSVFQMYFRWLNIFPFNHPYFQKAGGLYKRTLPLFDGMETIKFDKYLGTLIGKGTSPHKLAKDLLTITERLIHSTDSVRLLEEGKIKDPQELQRATICANHQAKQKSLGKSFEGDEADYVKLIKEWLQNETDFWKEITPLLPLSSKRKTPTSTTFAPAPRILGEYLEDFFHILKDYFEKQNHETLHKLFETGCDAEMPLLFLNSGNKLADAFKQMYTANLILGCQKKDLEVWLARNFIYQSNKNQPLQFKPRYLNDIISTNKDKCKSPILNVKKENGQYRIEKV